MTRLVLAGAGHAHAQVLLDLIRAPLTGVEVVLVSPSTLAPYSGMVPAWLAGDYSWEECCIDFSSLCVRANARFVVGEIIAIDADHRKLRLADGMQLDYDWLSLNIGSTLTPPECDTVQVMPMRPLSALQSRWQTVLDGVSHLSVGVPCNVVVVGGGAAGIETMLAAHHRLRTLSPHADFTFTLATQGAALSSGLSPTASADLQRHLKQRAIRVKTGFAATHCDGSAVVAADGSTIAADIVLWATGAQAFSWPREGGIATDGRGFVRVDAQLRSVSHPTVFASGDCASWSEPLPKAGVYAVRMGPVLTVNLRVAIDAGTRQNYAPQRRYLVLVGTGDRYAVASWGPFGWQGAWVYRWKHWIDRRFLARFAVA